MIHMQTLLPGGVVSFVALPLPQGGPAAVQDAIVTYRDQVWPEGIAVQYSWTDEPGTGQTTVPHPEWQPQSATAAAAQTGLNGEIPWLGVGAAALLVFLLFSRRKGA